MPRFSIVICTYQRHHLLSRAVGSVLSQGIEDLEVIVVDDGTTTGDVRAILAGLSDTRVKLFQNKQNCGLAFSTNRGIQEATGELVVFLDDDDELCPGFLESTDLHLRSTGDAFCWCGIALFSPEGKRLSERIVEFCQPDIKSQQMVAAMIGSGFGLTVRRECLEQVGGYDENLQTCTDVELLLRLVQGSWTWSCLPQVLIKVNQQEERMTLRRVENAQSLYYIVNKHRRFLRSHRTLCSVLHWEMGTLMADAGERQWVRKVFGKYLLESPTDFRAWFLLISNELRHSWLGMKLLTIYRHVYHRFS